MIAGLFLVAVLRMPGAAKPARAEYAVRWNPAGGGPASAAEVLALLEASGTRATVFTVRYFDLPPPSGAPADAAVILRQRTGPGGDSDIRLKYRRTRPLEGKWSCPDGARFEKESEVDVSFGGAPEPARVYSYSCSLEAREPPASLAAVAKPCVSRVTRHAFGGWKVEDWALPGGERRLEVSRTAPDTEAQAAEFGRMVAKLRARGARPLDESKTELGSKCPDGGAPP